VGYHGRDVDSIIKDLVNQAQTKIKKKVEEACDKQIRERAKENILDILTQDDPGIPGKNIHTRMRYQEELENGNFDKHSIICDGKTRTVGELRNEIIEHLKSKLLPSIVKKETIRAVEESGIVFLDEIDKIVLPQETHRHGPDVSSEGVQRDLLPLIEGTSVITKIGRIDTHKILFITSGAFHSCKPSDMLAELQGRLPIRVEMKPLTQEDMLRILTEPEFNLIRQQIELMRAEKISLKFTEDAIQEIAAVSTEINTFIENIGARRLHTVIEKVTEDLSFNCEPKDGEVIIDAELIRKKVRPMLEKADLKRRLI